MRVRGALTIGALVTRESSPNTIGALVIKGSGPNTYGLLLLWGQGALRKGLQTLKVNVYILQQGGTL